MHFQPYGLAITKTTARKAGCNPVWYSHMAFEKGTFERFPITAINEMVTAAVADATVDGKIDSEKLSEAPIFKLTPFFEQMGYTPSLRKEFWWEREWRHISDFHLGPASRIVAILAPAHDHAPTSRRPHQDPRILGPAPDPRSPVGARADARRHGGDQRPAHWTLSQRPLMCSWASACDSVERKCRTPVRVPPSPFKNNKFERI